MSTRTKQAYDRWGTTYDADSNPHLILEYDTVLRLVAPAPGQRILDADCGTGRYATAFHALGADVVGVDFSEAMLTVAAAKAADIPFVKADLTEPLPFEDAYFDTVNCAQALKHLPDLRPVLRELARVLQPGGALTFSVTHPDMTWDGYVMRREPDFILSQEADIHHHTLEAYREALGAAGLVIDQEVTVRVTEIIAPLLTKASFEQVQGRPQILVVKAMK